MEKKYQKQPRTAKEQFVIKDKSIVGGYFNVARVNFYKTIINIFATVGIRGTYGEEKIERVLDALYKKLAGKENELTEEQSGWSRNLRLKNDQMIKMQKLLFRHLPVLGPIMADVASFKVYKNKKSNVVNEEELMRGVTLVDCIEVISIMAACLSDCRNYYTHYNPYNSDDDLVKQYKRQEKVARWLDKAFVASRRIDKKRNGITTNEMEFLTGIDHYFSQRKKDEDNNNIPVKDEKGRIKTDKRTGAPLYEMEFIERDNYYFKISGERIISSNNTGAKESYPALSDFGIIYFCSLFLSKTYTKLLTEQTELFAEERSPFKGVENDIVREMLCIYRIRTPKGKRLDSQDDTTTLAMDMLNELRKCPMELYNVLGREGQQFFEDKILRENEHTPEVSKRLRATDRFPYLVMRYIDQKKTIFNRIRFQVQLGKFRFKFYDKQCVDGSLEVRSWQKEINGYGRLQEVEEKRIEKYANMIQQSEIVPTKLEHEDLHLDLTQFVEDTLETKPYITNHKTSYIIHNNRIGMYWEESQRPDKQPFFNGTGMYLPDLMDEAGNPSVLMLAPKAVLSVYDMPAMMFYQYLLEKNDTLVGKDFPKTEDIIIHKYDTLYDFFKKVSSGEIKPYENRKCFSEALNDYGLSISEIPEKLVDYLSSKKSVENNQNRLVRLTTERVKQRLERLIRRRDHYKEDRKMVGNKENKYGKDSYADVRHGKLAQFLSESIVSWLSPKSEARQKLTGLNYSKMQAFFATYGATSSFNDLTLMLQSAALIDIDDTHPFLQKVLDQNPQNIEMFYLTYLNEEIEYLKSFFNKDQHGNITDIKKPVAFEKLPFMHHERQRWQIRDDDYYKKLAGRYLNLDGKEASIILPDGLFTPYILKLLSQAYSDKEALQIHINDKMTYNASYLINSFFECVLDDYCQPFYISYKRDKKTDAEIPNKFARSYDLFNILNNEKVRNALQPIYLTTNEINSRLTSKILDEFGKPIGIVGKKGKLKRDVQGNILYQKAIEKEIKDFVNKMQYRDRGNHKTLDEAKEAMIVKLHHCVRDVKNNERAIRRYKTQDMILFIMAKGMLSTVISTQNAQSEENLFMLSKVCGEKFLRQTVRFEYPVKVDDIEIKVVQDNMSLKNYGEFYRFLNDDRLLSLLKQLEGVNEVDHSELMGEFTIYDLRRSEIFKAMQLLEKIAFEAFESDLSNPESVNFSRNGVPRRNNFRSLLTLFSEADGHQLDEEACNRLIEIRNAFCHNTFKINLSGIRKELPTITNQLIGEIDRLINEAKFI